MYAIWPYAVKAVVTFTSNYKIWVSQNKNQRYKTNSKFMLNISFDANNFFFHLFDSISPISFLSIYLNIFGIFCLRPFFFWSSNINIIFYLYICLVNFVCIFLVDLFNGFVIAKVISAIVFFIFFFQSMFIFLYWMKQLDSFSKWQHSFHKFSITQ